MKIYILDNDDMMLKMRIFRLHTGKLAEGAEKAVVEIVGLSPGRFSHPHQPYS